VQGSASNHQVSAQLVLNLVVHEPGTRSIVGFAARSTAQLGNDCAIVI
jgi:hypothetical protein